MDGELFDLRGAKKSKKLSDRRNEKPNKKWLEEARRIASIKDSDAEILKKLKMKKR